MVVRADWSDALWNLKTGESQEPGKAEAALKVGNGKREALSKNQTNRTNKVMTEKPSAWPRETPTRSVSSSLSPGQFLNCLVSVLRKSPSSLRKRKPTSLPPPLPLHPSAFHRPLIFVSSAPPPPHSQASLGRCPQGQLHALCLVQASGSQWTSISTDQSIQNTEGCQLHEASLSRARMLALPFS